MNDPTHEQVPGPDSAPAMDDAPASRGGGQDRGGHRADGGPELTRRAVGPRLYHKKSRMGCLRCKARRVKVSDLIYALLFPCYVQHESGVCHEGRRGSLYMHVL